MSLALAPTSYQKEGNENAQSRSTLANHSLLMPFAAREGNRIQPYTRRTSGSDGAQVPGSCSTARAIGSRPTLDWFPGAAGFIKFASSLMVSTAVSSSHQFSLEQCGWMFTGYHPPRGKGCRCSITKATSPATHDEFSACLILSYLRFAKYYPALLCR